MSSANGKWPIAEVLRSLVFLSLVLLLPLPASAGTYKQELERLRKDLQQTQKAQKECAAKKRELTAEIQEVEAGRRKGDLDYLRRVLEEVEQVRKALEEQEPRTRAHMAELEIPMDNTTGVTDVCRVHKVQMRVVRAPVVYGMLGYATPQPRPPLRDREFPFALDVFLGGCSVDHFKEAWIYVCPACQRAEKQWYNVHPK